MEAGRGRAEEELGDFGLSLPVVVKVPGETGGIGVQIISEAKELNNALGLLQEDERLWEGVLVQEAVRGRQESTANWVAFAGELLAVTVVEYELLIERDLYVRHGASSKHTGMQLLQWAEQPCEVRTMVTELVQRTRYSGFGCVNYKTLSGNDGTVKVKIIEVNPRVCGSMASGESSKFISLPRFVQTYIGAWKQQFGV
eukprot:819901-Rhodomonas_salina.1